jgi:hypothetical protein
MADGNDPDLSEQRKTVERLRDAVEQAKALYKSAKEEYERAEERLDRSGAKEIMRTMALKDSMFERYRRAIEDFNCYVLHARLPDQVQMLPTNREED